MSQRHSLARTDEVAAYLQKPPRTLEQWRYRGTGPNFVKVGGRDVRYRWADVEAWLDEQSRTAA